MECLNQQSHHIREMINCRTGVDGQLYDKYTQCSKSHSERPASHSFAVKAQNLRLWHDLNHYYYVCAVL